MSKQLHTAIKSILEMPYFKNEHARSGGAVFGHEEAVANKIRESGFSEVDKASYPKLTKSLLKKWADGTDDAKLREATKGMPAGTFILQPAGTQGFPDILVKDFNDRFVAVECKSGQNGLCPMWNDNVPKLGSVIYVLSSGAVDQTTVFLGRDVITQEEIDLMAEQEKEIAEIVKKYNTLIESHDRFGRGWVQKSRKQHFQGGGGAKTNYFTHSTRNTCEQNALNFALE